MDLDLRRFWTFYRPFTKALSEDDRAAAIKIMEDMGASFPGERWKGMVLKFMDHFGEVPEHIHTMMMLAPSDENLKEYLEKRGK